MVDDFELVGKGQAANDGTEHAKAQDFCANGENALTLLAGAEQRDRQRMHGINALPDLDFVEAADLPVRRFDAGEKIFLEDDLGDFLYIVRSGLVNIVTYGKVLEDVGPGGIFGEIAMVDTGPRSASAMAAIDSEVIVVDRDAFLDLVRSQPKFALTVMQALAGHIRRTTGV